MTTSPQLARRDRSTSRDAPTTDPLGPCRAGNSSALRLAPIDKESSFTTQQSSNLQFYQHELLWLLQAISRYRPQRHEFLSLTLTRIILGNLVV
jgi:hypothetical protein